MNAEATNFASRLGLVLVGSVAGNSVYKPRAKPGAWRSGEVERSTAVLADSRQRALNRLTHQAQRRGATIVLDVTITRRRRRSKHDAIEILATGTALRRLDNEDALLMLSGLGLAEHYVLTERGYEVAGLVAASTVYYVVASAETVHLQAAMRQNQTNGELKDFSQGLYEARRLAFSKLRSQTAGLDCIGLLDARIDYEVQALPTSRAGSEGEDIVITLEATATAIRGSQSSPRPPATVVFSLTDQ